MTSANLLLPANALEWQRVRFLVHETTSVGVTLCPSLILRVVGLRAVLYDANTVPVTNRWILCHCHYLSLLRVVATPTRSARNFKSPVAGTVAKTSRNC